MKLQYGGDGKKEDPHIGNKVGDIREVPKGDQVHTLAIERSPPGLDGPALKTKHYFHCDKPHEYE
jgi:hypothetical protein